MKLIEFLYELDNSNEVWETDIEDSNFITHNRKYCFGQYCSIHNPSDHFMKDWPQNWRSDRGLMERICPNHGVGCPDPDDMLYFSRTHNEKETYARGIHGCCGCGH